MIVKIIFLDLDNKEFTMLFGNSYKNWITQFEEYLYQRISWYNAKKIMSCDIYKIINVQKATDRWIGYGGLKWCSDTTFQESLDYEANGLKWKKTRQYKDMTFNYDANKFYKTRNWLKDRLRHLALSTNLKIKKELSLA